MLQIDLTQEKRYTLNPVSKKIMKKLPDGILVKVYLDGDIPIRLKKLRNATQDILDQFRTYSSNRIDYQFIDPLENPDKKIRQKIVESLYDKGLQPTNIKIKDDKGNLSEKLVIPGAIVCYNNKEMSINLLLKNIGETAEININNSIQALEYNLVNAMICVTRDSIDKIAILEGHGELNEYQTADISHELQMNSHFRVYRGKISEDIHCLDPYKIIIIAKPTMPYSEREKLILDQYIMNGGRVLWLIDQLKIELDSLSEGPMVAFVNKTNLDDMLFKYGVRINTSLLQDVQCAVIPVNISLADQAPKFVPSPFLYLPLAMPSKTNPICRNINLIYCEFANNIDTVGKPGMINKTVLLSSSVYSRRVNAPVMISLEEINKKLQPVDFNAPMQIVSVLLEGSFQSVFTNRMLNDLNFKGELSFKDHSKPTKMIIVGDGDIIKNNFHQTIEGFQITPLGFDRYSQQTYGNKDFIVNALNYLTDEIGVISLRSREVKLRLLDKERIKVEKLKWQLINILLPIIIIILFGILIHFYRKKKYSI